MNKFISINEAAKKLGVSLSTLRRWDKSGLLVAERTPKGHRRYDINKLNSNNLNNQTLLKKDLQKFNNKKTIAYARVSSNDQKSDLHRQIEILELYCAKNGWNYEIISDLGSGINYKKKGLKLLLNLILNNEIERLVLTHKDRLLRFGAELIFTLCNERNIDIVIINQGKDLTFEQELVNDVLEIITIFSAKLYGSRSNKNKKLINTMKNIMEENNNE